MNKLPAKLLILWGLLASGCVDPYRPPEISAPDSYLVVNGFFNSQPGTTSTIRLSRTQNLTDTRPPVIETRAQVTIESGRKAVITLTESSAGTYTLTGVTPQADEAYRLHIRTAKGAEYYSDYVPVVQPPPIDSLSWRVENNGVQISVNTHDPTNATRYYRWEYDATWEYRATFNSTKEVRDNEIVDRQESVYRCWSTEGSTNILTTATTRLSQDRVSQFPITFIPPASPKLFVRYSILVRQVGLTKAGFTYYDQLAKLTQNVGSIFDPQPAKITGNIHSAAIEDELVLGFFRIGSIQTKRLFISNSQLPRWLSSYGLGNCKVDTLTLAQVRLNKPFIVAPYQPPGGPLLYLTTSIDCIDCRQKGGINKQPDFW